MTTPSGLKHVVVAGSTGQVGLQIMRHLAQRRDCQVTALVRRPGRLGVEAPHIREFLFDFEDPASYLRLGAEIPCDILLCALGTTLQQAGGAKGLIRVDRDYPVFLIEALSKLKPPPLFGLVSSVGADWKPRETYLRAKHEVEQALAASPLPHVVVRPSFLLSNRVAFRPLEMIVGKILARPYLFLARHLAPHSRLIWKYAPVQVARVAEALIQGCLDDPPASGAKILEGLALHGR